VPGSDLSQDPVFPVEAFVIFHILWADATIMPLPLRSVPIHLSSINPFNTDQLQHQEHQSVIPHKAKWTCPHLRSIPEINLEELKKT